MNFKVELPGSRRSTWITASARPIHARSGPLAHLLTQEMVLFTPWLLGHLIMPRAADWVSVRRKTLHGHVWSENTISRILESNADLRISSQRLVQWLTCHLLMSPISNGTRSPHGILLGKKYCSGFAVSRNPHMEYSLVTYRTIFPGPCTARNLFHRLEEGATVLRSQQS